MFLFLINLAIAGEAKIFAYWPSTPDVNICDENINQQMVLNALEHWKELGHSVGKVYIRKNCIYKEGNIYIRLSQEDVPSYEWANTYSNWNPYTHIYKKATINFSEESLNMQRIYTHELGHAFGYIHTKEENHIMHGPKGPFDHLAYKRASTK